MHKKIDKNGQKQSKTINKGQQWSTTDHNGQFGRKQLKRFNPVKISQKWSKTVKNTQNTDKNGQKRSKTINKRQQWSKTI
jgi:hypothetical protein